MPKFKKKTLGICIPYYKNSGECEIKFRLLMEQIKEQLTDDMLLYIYEDGQVSDWLEEYKSHPNIQIIQNRINKGVSFARNVCLDDLVKKCLYVLFIDSDDKLSDNYLSKMHEYCADNTHDIIESAFMFKGNLYPFQPNVKRSGCAGSALRTKMIGAYRFDERLQVGEDTKFMNELIDFRKHRKKYCKDAIYYYNYGANPNSLIMLHERKEIGKERV